MNTTIKNQFGRVATASAAAAILASAHKSNAADLTEKEKNFLENLQDESPLIRQKAWTNSQDMSASVIPPLVKLMDHENPGVAKAAFESIDQVVHSVGKKTTGEKRKAVVEELLKLLSDDTSKEIRMHAYRWLSLIGNEEVVPDVAKAIHDPEWMEEVVFCLERIPGDKSIETLIAALKKDEKIEHKMRILAALGHRKATQATDLAAQYMGSYNTDLALAAMMALARIGKKPAGDVQLPEYESLTDVEKTDFADSYLRYADARARDGAIDDALKIYGFILSNSEKEHLQCASIVGISKIGNPDMVPMIINRLDSQENTVRITAKKALIAMKGEAIEAKLKEAAKTADGDQKEILEEILKTR